MQNGVEPGRYVVAVSGGVDSMALLDMLREQSNVQLIVAHFDHGIRPDSNEDRKLVQSVASDLGLQFIFDRANLGPNTSEDIARKARYEFLHTVRRAAQARALITAHHQDDLVETAILNMIRGTGRKGLSSLKSTDVIKRPLLTHRKTEIKNYAQSHGLVWREDTTNTDTTYLRNYIRHTIIPKLSNSEYDELLGHIRRAHDLNREIDSHLQTHLHIQPATDLIDRHYFVMLPHVIAGEIMATWLHRHSIRNIDKRMINRLVTIAKTSLPNRIADVNKQYILRVNSDTLALEPRDR